MAHKIYIVGNWKMNLTVSEASLLLQRLDKQITKVPSGVEVVLCPPMISLQALSIQLKGTKFKLGAQNLYPKDEGPVTGEVSAAMLRGIADYAIIGHSERRKLFDEKDSDIALKVSAALRHHIVPILCVGETLLERQAGETNQVLSDQLYADLNMLTAEDVQEVIIAYEPVWAISDGTDFKHHVIPKPDEIESAVGQIRTVIKHLHDKETADAVHILYGASSNADLALDLLRLKGVNGLLVGGDSLNYQDFATIVAAAGKARRG